MKLSAARAIASIVSDDELKEDYIIPGAFDKRVAPAVAKAVMDCAKASGISKLGNKCFYVAALSVVFKQNTPYILFE